LVPEFDLNLHGEIAAIQDRNLDRMKIAVRRYIKIVAIADDEIVHTERIIDDLAIFVSSIDIDRDSDICSGVR
jgi:hypothetical protein